MSEEIELKEYWTECQNMSRAEKEGSYRYYVAEEVDECLKELQQRIAVLEFLGEYS